ncbi:MAG: hypothetical protein AABZ30_07860 [Myxococcota bacterium]
MTRRVLIVLIVLSCAGCGGEAADAEEPAEAGTLRGLARDAWTERGVPRALVCVERGGLYVNNRWVDEEGRTTVGNPSFAFGAIADDSGVFEVHLPGARAGLHVFADGYRYGAERVSVDGDIEATVLLEPNLPKDSVPIVSDLILDPAMVAPGATFRLRVVVFAGSALDPLSEEVLAIQPETHACAALDPPAPGSPGVAFPDGEWSRTLVAPSAPGQYETFLVVSTEGCITSDRVSAVLTVK